MNVISLFYQRQWSLATSTNYSFLFPGANHRRIVISRSGADKGRFSLEDFMEVDENGDAMPEYSHMKPSAETFLHTMLYRDKNAAAVLHTHSVPGTLVSLRAEMEGEIRFRGYEMMKGFQGVSDHESEISIPVFPNSQDIAALSVNIMPNLNVIPAFLISGHGLYAWGESIAMAQRHIETAEFLLACRLQEK